MGGTLDVADRTTSLEVGSLVGGDCLVVTCLLGSPAVSQRGQSDGVDERSSLIRVNLVESGGRTVYGVTSAVGGVASADGVDDGGLLEHEIGGERAVVGTHGLPSACHHVVVGSAVDDDEGSHVELHTVERLVVGDDLLLGEHGRGGRAGGSSIYLRSTIRCASEGVLDSGTYDEFVCITIQTNVGGVSVVGTGCNTGHGNIIDDHVALCLNIVIDMERSCIARTISRLGSVRTRVEFRITVPCTEVKRPTDVVLGGVHTIVECQICRTRVRVITRRGLRRTGLGSCGSCISREQIGEGPVGIQVVYRYWNHIPRRINHCICRSGVCGGGPSCEYHGHTGAVTQIGVVVRTGRRPPISCQFRCRIPPIEGIVLRGHDTHVRYRDVRPGPAVHVVCDVLRHGFGG